MAEKTSPLKIIPLGGCEEIGRNMTVLEYENDMIVIDCGLMFPGEEMHGIDFVIPDTTYIEQNVKKLRGMLITHGHEDHIGGLPYILPKITPKIFATRLTKGLIDVKLQEFNVVRPQIGVVEPGQKIQLGVFQIEPFRVTHSIPDAVGYAIRTPVGLVVHTGDFKIDNTPVDGMVFDFARLSRYSREGVLALLSDSTNAEVEGYSPSEKTLQDTFDQIFEKAEGRVIITSFASLINRIQQVIDSAIRYNRKVAISGRSMANNIKVALKLGYLKFPPEVIVPIQEAAKLPPKNVAILCTGSQGEEMSALRRMASGEHRQIKITKGDTVVISASPIPGNERAIHNTINALFKRGAHVIYGKKLDIHVSGHGSREELKMMISMLSPKYFIPVHGEYRHLKLHGELAIQVGVKPENVFILENGEIVEITQNTARKSDKKVPVKMVFVDAGRAGDVGNVVLKDRQVMANEGVFVAIVVVDKKTGKLLASPEVITRGFVYMKTSEDLLRAVKSEIRRFMEAEVNTNYQKNWAVIRSQLKERLAEFLQKETGREPMVLVVTVEM